MPRERLTEAEGDVFREQLRILLKERGISGAELDRKLGYNTHSGQMTNRWLSGAVRPNWKNVIRVATVLNVNVGQLV